MKRADRKPPRTAWRAPTRRAFVAMLGAAATALAIEHPVRQALRDDHEHDHDDDRPRSTWAGTTRWIGHC
jgi:hypothetical protein